MELWVWPFLIPFFVLRLVSSAPWTEENARWNVNFETKHSPNDYYGEWPGHTYFPSPEDWRSLSIYQLLTDRFADGDPTNNEAAEEGFDVRDMTYRHGGDFKGLTEKLSYIKGLGCQAIWLSPIFQNGPNMYHQYAQHDFTLLDKRLGTLEELRTLTTEAHRLGMYVLVDVVMNHMDNEFYFEGHKESVAPFRFHGNSTENREYRLITRRAESKLYSTPAGKQPYMDFWYNNTWDAEAQYQGREYGQWGESVGDTGHGTYDGSDFHHNGDLYDYFKPWEINLGKIYGTMDDLRLEHPRVQEKYIAMSKALIASTDVDGFRVDTPMQVPLPFFQAWAPAVREFAKTLGKERFAMWGEFYVTPYRYATMMGRGRDNTMYGQDLFIGDKSTLKGGIVYSYYWYTFTAMVYKQADLADGLALAYSEEAKMLDIVDPVTQSEEYTMWNFCNNHDNWRMQVLTGFDQFHMCLSVITFWPGLSLHYAGDEQDFNTPGSALDGWAREELGVSLAWRAVRTNGEDGNPADGDNFDMSSRSYRYVARLNGLRRYIFGNFGSEQCDVVVTPESKVPEVLVFTRGCTEDKRITVVANYNTEEDKEVVVPVPYSSGTVLIDLLPESERASFLVSSNSTITVSLPALAAMALHARDDAPALPPTVASVSPGHGSVLEPEEDATEVTVTVKFDQSMQESIVYAATLDGEAVFTCTATDCSEITARLYLSAAQDGRHEVKVSTSAESVAGLAFFAPFTSAFILKRAPSIVADPTMNRQVGLICEDHTKLCHQATGADKWRALNMGDEEWSAWQSYSEKSDWISTPGRAVLVQYHAETSSAYIVGDCLGADNVPCFASWHANMNLRGDFNGWGERHSGMGLIGDYTWAIQVTVEGYGKAKFAPYWDWRKSYGRHTDRPLLYNLPDYDKRSKTFNVVPLMSGSEASRRWMATRGLWSPNEALASGAEFATELWIGAGCTAEAPECPVPDNGDWDCVGFSRPEQNMDWCRAQGTTNCMEYAENDGSPEMVGCKGCSCCARKVTPVLTGPPAECCVLFNDLTLNYTVSSDLTACEKITEVPEMQVPQTTTTKAHHAQDQAPDWTTTAPPVCQASAAAQSTNPDVLGSVEWSKGRLYDAEQQFEKSIPASTRMESPETWHSEITYSVLIDRFANGDIKNDKANIPDFQQTEMEEGKAWSLPRWRHGGDLQGLKGRLPYLKDLGVTAVSISPVWKNSRGDYDGACTSDITQIDPGFGHTELLKDLVHDAHALGLRVILEVGVNQACGRGLAYVSGTQGSVDRVNKCVEMFSEAYWNGERGDEISDDGRGELRWDKGDLPASLQHQSFFARCGPRSMFRPDGKDISELEEDEYKTVQAAMMWTEPAEYDESGNLIALVYNTMDVGFQTVFTNLLKWWIAYADIDGYRLRSAADISADFTSYISTQTRSHAKALGKSNFLVVGNLDLSLAHLGAQQLGQVRPASNLNATALGPLPNVVEGLLRESCSDYLNLNPAWPGLLAASHPVEAFHIQELAKGEVQPSEFYDREEWLKARAEVRAVMQYQADIQDTWNAFEMPDRPRVLSMTGATASGQSWRLQVGLAWSFSWYGMPNILAGAELGFNGLCFKSVEDQKVQEAKLIENGMDPAVAKDLLEKCDYMMMGQNVESGYWNQDMFIGGPFRLGSSLEAIDKHSEIRESLMGAGGPHWCEDPLLDRTNPVFTLVRSLSRIRRSCPAMRSADDEDAQAVTAPYDELAYWKFNKESLWEGLPGPAAMLVVLKFSAEPSEDSSFAEYYMPDGLNYKEGQAFLDILNPSRMAMVVQKNGRLSLLIPAVMDRGNVAIFAPNTEIKPDEGGEWYVCSGFELPPLPQFKCEVAFTELVYTWGGFTLVAAIVVVVLLRNSRSGIYLSVVKEATPPQPPKNAAQRTAPQHVLTAAIEHTIPERDVKVRAGGLGVVLNQMLKEHPEGTLSCVHPMFGDVDYGNMDHYKDFEIVVDGKTQTAKIYKLSSEENNVKRVWYLVSHDLFEERSCRQPYPSPLTKLRVLQYFSLWNQVVALLIQDLQPDVYHCMDYHAALAPLYVSKEAQVPTILVLHNADYMGVVETDFVNDRFWKTVPALRRLSLVFNMKRSSLRKYCIFEGRFNMLRAVTEYIKETQGGRGVCAVSFNYAAELMRERTLFRGLPQILALDNATYPAEDQGKTGIDLLKKQRFEAKSKLQQKCFLDQDPDAKILIFIGRWVKQKGVDHIAMLAPILLQSHPEVQIILAGPPDDACGLYAQELLAPIMPRFEGRLFVCTEFFMLESALRRGAHLCFAPSCSEPFGYVDVEFGLLGVPSVGCAVGGLSKMPGVYFRQQNADSSQMLLEAFLCSVDYALNLSDMDYWEMALNATKATFPFDTWRANLLEAYGQAQSHFRPMRGNQNHTLNDLWMQNAAVDIIRGELAQRRGTCFRPMSDAALVAQQMQVLDVDDNMEFITQAVSEERVHQIMKETMVQHTKRRGSGRMVKDAETLQRNICLAEQRLSERNHVTQWLMKPLFRSKYLRIHAVIGLCYIIAPAGESLLQAIEKQSDVAVYMPDYIRHWLFYSGASIGALFWLYLSRAVPPNLLMAISQLLNVLFSVLVPALPSTVFENESVIASMLAINGLMSSSRLLFIIWNFNEDFHGGFQVACKRIGILEALRSACVMLAVILSHLKMEYLYHQGVLLVSLSTLILLFKAPHCYCSYSLPPTGFFEGIFTRKSFVLLLVAEMLNHLTNYASQTYTDWWGLNGWSTADVITFSWATIILSSIMVPFVFGLLVKMSVWGPWAMRDFTCMLPPGSLLRALALWDIGYLHHRSMLFASAVIFSYVIDVLRSASIFAALMSILGNKWYALKGCYIVMVLTAACSAASPYVGDALARRMVGSTPFNRVTLAKSVGEVGSLGDSIFCAVVPLAATAYLIQLVTLRYFNTDIMTYRGHGSFFPDMTKNGTSATTVRVSISQLKRMRRVVGSSALRTKPRPAGEDDKAHDLHVDAEVGSVAPPSENPFRRDREDATSHVGAASQQSGVLSRMGASLQGSMPCSELVSEIEQQILFNLADRAISLPPLSRASSESQTTIRPTKLDEDKVSAVGSKVTRRQDSNLSAVSDSGSEDQSEDTASVAVVQPNPDFGDICAI